MNVLVTGANGFIGRTLVRKLSALGHRVACLVRKSEGASWMRDVRGLEPFPGDLRDVGCFEPHVPATEVVFHLAGLTKAVSRDEYLRVNGEATGALVRAFARGERARRFVYVSSLAVAGPCTAASPAREEDAPHPITPYGESKLLGEELLRASCGRLPWTVVRPPVVYGPHDRDVYLYFKAAARGLVPLVQGGRLELSMAHVEDVADALVLAAFSEPAAGKVYYVSDGGVHTSGEVAQLLLSIAGAGRILHTPDAVLKLAGFLGDVKAALTGTPALLNGHKVRESCQPGWVCSIDRIRADLAYAPRIELGDGLTSTFRWYRQNGWI